MITYFPEFYPDELVYSLFSRYHAKSGSLAYIYTAEEIYKWKHTKPDIEFINQLTEEAHQLITRSISMESIIEKHTMFPYYARFVSVDRKKRAMQSLVNMEGDLKSILNLEYKTGERYLRYCPICAAEDREKYGETYWHRNHQIKGIRICARHRCFLHDSDILMQRKDKPQLIAAESVVPDNENCFLCESEIEQRLAEYIIELFQSELDINTDIDIGAYLHHYLPEKYLSESKLQRHLSKMYADYREFYQGLPDDEILSLPQIQTLFNNKVTRCYSVCQLALFEKIPIQRLAEPEPIEKPINHIYEKISDEYGYDYELVCRIGTAVIREYQRENRVQKKCGAVSLAWEQMDKELLPEVKNQCLKIYGDGVHRPHRVTILAVQRAMKLPDKRIDRLPLCKAEIMRYKESQKEYWAREVVWAYEKIIKEGGIVCWRHIRDLTNIRNVDFQACKPYINKYADGKTTAAILGLL